MFRYLFLSRKRMQNGEFCWVLQLVVPLRHGGDGDQRYCLMAVDIEHFKIFNEWYGQEAGDRFLKIAGPKRGLVPPDEFIPVLENSGFMAKLDMYVWDMVCSSVRGWLDRGYRVVPISVNVSRADIYTVDVAECFCGLIKKYRLDPSLMR